jgi:hypothetical protein
VGFSLGQILPGNYRVKVLWKKKAADANLPMGGVAAKDCQPEAGDLVGESEPITVAAGITSQPEMFKCDRIFTGK